jgi:hypothetical protein
MQLHKQCVLRLRPHHCYSYFLAGIQRESVRQLLVEEEHPVTNKY